MAFDFPASPTNGQVFTSGGVSYVWNGQGWVQQGAPGSVDKTYVDTADALKVAKAGDTMTGDLTIGKTNPGVILKKTATNGQGSYIQGNVNANARWQVHLGSGSAETGSGNTGSDFVVNRFDDAGAYIDTPLTILRSTGQTLFKGVPAAPLDALAYNGMQINGSMEVNQEGTTIFSLPTGDQQKYIVDGWYAHKTGTSVLNVFTAATGLPGLPTCIQLNATTPQPTIGSDVVRFMTHIEGYRVSRLGWGTTSAMPLTVGFWARMTLSGTYRVIAGNFDYSTFSPWVPFIIVASGVWQWVTVTIPGSTTGTWKVDNTIGLKILIEVASSGTPNTVGAINQFAAITGVVMLPGTQAPTAAQSPLIMRPYDQELLTCKRYYQKHTVIVETGALFQVWAFPVQFRASPTITGGGAGFTINPDTAICAVYQTARAFQTLSCDARL
jgi:hypothetical protein